MEEIKVPHSKGLAIFGETSNGFYRNIVIKDGEIVRTSYSSAYCCGYRVENGDPNFVEECSTAIAFITDIEPKKLRDIYHALSEGEMKDFCKKLQAVKVAELQF